MIFNNTVRHILFTSYGKTLFSNGRLLRRIVFQFRRTKLLYTAKTLTRVIGLSTTLPLIRSIGWLSKTETPEQKASMGRADLINKADALYDAYLIDLAYQHVAAHKNSDDPEILWRVGRIFCDKGKLTYNPKEKERLMREGFECLERALKLDDTNWAVHKWYAIMLNYVSEFDGKKAVITAALTVKEHFERAVALNPGDATTWHLLGIWCMSLADLRWYERKIASAIFASPPESSHEEALSYFLKAEEISPGFYSQNLLYLARVYQKLGQTNLAKQYTDKCLKAVVVTADDRAAHDEAEKFMKTL